MKRIDIFAAMQSRYQVLNSFIASLQQAFLLRGLHCRLLYTPQDILSSLTEDPPDCTLSFNDIFAEAPTFLCDVVKIPHLSYTVDSAHRFLRLTKSPYSLIASVDRCSVDLFRANKFSNIFFMPHATDASYSPDPLLERSYDVVMLSSFIDYDAVMESWSATLPIELVNVMKMATEIAISERSLPIHQAIHKAWASPGAHQALDLSSINGCAVFDQIVAYVQGRERLELLKAVKDARVDLFGWQAEQWKKYVGERPHITYHEAISFGEAIEVMKRSKLLLHSCAWIKNGAHERLLSALACGALPMAESNPYLMQQFCDGRSIVFYSSGDWGQLNEKIHYYLGHEEERTSVVEKGRNIVMERHTWDIRAAQLIQAIEPIVDRLLKERRSLR